MVRTVSARYAPQRQSKQRLLGKSRTQCQCLILDSTLLIGSIWVALEFS
ncbi:unnamed protein product [Chondrus crispus]|uniref:Uncharacterized protein n=1 Tax=Chondrus crispus TaxID=2769 RepID=R7Q4H7_CHOCR|nr:unnamed protein product [Chondrus crispus]CDF32266.1 unnamed protein product [Chondrus crispus]|eukprot:XP_005711931.1 unnamed protein product [Chondrus crispus]